MPDTPFPIGQRVTLPGHFPEPVVLEAVRPIGTGYECRVRLLDGTPDEAILSQEEAAAAFGRTVAATTHVRPADAEKIRLLIESARIRLAYTHDRHFAVSLSGIRTLPHQIEAVYLKMLPQPRLRLLLADDPGAGKTIMAGLLLKELKLREAIDRVLILCPAPLTIQWQDELLRWFGEPFDIIFSAVDQQQLVNPWQRSTQVIASLDYAKQDDVRERVWQQRWDIVTDARTLQGTAAEAMKVLAAHDGSAFEESYNLLNAWLAVIPGNGACNLRRLALLETNLADLSFLFTLDRGEPTSRHLRAPALMAFETPADSPYWLNLHVDDVGHTLVLGATGSRSSRGSGNRG